MLGVSANLSMKPSQMIKAKGWFKMWGIILSLATLFIVKTTEHYKWRMTKKSQLASPNLHHLPSLSIVLRLHNYLWGWKCYWGHSLIIAIWWGFKTSKRIQAMSSFLKNGHSLSILFQLISFKRIGSKSNINGNQQPVNRKTNNHHRITG